MDVYLLYRFWLKLNIDVETKTQYCLGHPKHDRWPTQQKFQKLHNAPKSHNEVRIFSHRNEENSEQYTIHSKRIKLKTVLQSFGFSPPFFILPNLPLFFKQKYDNGTKKNIIRTRKFYPLSLISPPFPEKRAWDRHIFDFVLIPKFHPPLARYSLLWLRLADDRCHRLQAFLLFFRRFYSRVQTTKGHWQSPCLVPPVQITTPFFSMTTDRFLFPG